MADVLTPEQRRLNMSRVRGRDTKPEMLIRRGLHERGLRYRLQERSLPGRPDLIFPKCRTAVFVHGCFWHAHGCSLSKLPKTREQHWAKKLAANVSRDRAALLSLTTNGWRVLVIWECALRGPRRLDIGTVLDRAVAFIRNEVKPVLEIAATSATNSAIDADSGGTNGK